MVMGSKSGLPLALSGLVFFIFSSAALAQDSSLSLKPADSARESSRFPIEGDYSLNLGGASIQEGKNTLEGAYLYFSPNFTIRLMPELKAKISPWGRFISARIQDRFNDDEDTGFIFLNDAYLAYSPAEWVEVRGGMLSQSVLRTSMMVSSYASFPGGQLRLTNPAGKDLRLTTVFQYLIPTSQSGTADRDRSEKTPAFRTAHAELDYTGLSGWEFGVYGGYYQWDNLPSKVAIKSATRGNANVDGELVTRFTSGFRGFFGGAEACYCKARYGFGFDFKRMRNIEAQDYSADGQMVGGGPRLKWKDVELDLNFRSYFIESDATVAYYNRSRLGHTNRVGENAEAVLRFPKNKFALYFEMFNARPISRDDNQRNLQAYFFGVETDNVSFF